MYEPHFVGHPSAEHAMPQLYKVSLRCVISMSLSLICDALSAPLYYAASAAAPITTSPTPALQPP